MRKVYAAIIVLFLLAPACAVFRSGNKSGSDSLSLKREVVESKASLNTEGYKEIKFSYADSGKSLWRLELFRMVNLYILPKQGFREKRVHCLLREPGKAGSWA